MNTRRIAAIALFHLRIGVAREREAQRLASALAEASDEQNPLAVVVGEQEERELQGGTRIHEVDAEAYALGVRPGMTIAAARARAAFLRVRVVRPESVQAALFRLAESLLAFGATTSVHLASEEAANDAVYVDVTGCAHLHACAADPSGEHVLAARIGAHVTSLGFAARVAIANGPNVAHAIARHAASISPARANTRGRDRAHAVVVLPGTEREAMAPLPLGALPLDEGGLRFLRKLGLMTVADLADLPKDALGSRLGNAAAIILPLARGEDTAPLVPYLPPEVPEERFELEDPVERTDALLFVAKMLTDRMSNRIEGRGLKTSGLDLVFELERSLVPEGQSPRAELSLKLAAPIGRASELFAIVRARLESYEVIAPIKAVVVRCRELAAAQGKALSLFEAEPKTERALPELAAELTTLLGKENVGVLAVSDGWRLDRRTQLVPFAEAKHLAPAAHRVTSFAGEEPLRLLPEPIERDIPRIAPLVMRIEAVEWWRAPSTDPLDSHASSALPGAARDFVVAWDEDEKAAAWLELDRSTGRAWLRGWKE